MAPAGQGRAAVKAMRLSQALAGLPSQLSPIRDSECIKLGEPRNDRHGASMVVPSEKQGTAMLSALTTMDGFVVLSETCEEIREGDLVDFLSVRLIKIFKTLAVPVSIWPLRICGMMLEPEEAKVRRNLKLPGGWRCKEPGAAAKETLMPCRPMAPICVPT